MSKDSMLSSAEGSDESDDEEWLEEDGEDGKVVAVDEEEYERKRQAMDAVEYASRQGQEDAVNAEDEQHARAKFEQIDSSVAKELQLQDDEELARQWQTTQRPPKWREAGPLLPGVCGLKNMGKTCYMNSILQCLGHTEPLVHAILVKEPMTDQDGKDAPMAELERLIKDLWSGKHHILSPDDFVLWVHNVFPRFKAREQHDCHEFFTDLLDRLSRLPLGVPAFDDALRSQEWFVNSCDSAIASFYGQCRYQTTCSSCNKMKHSFDWLLGMSVPLKQEEGVSLMDCINIFLKPEQLGEDNKWNCPGCDSSTRAWKQIDLWRLPKVLIIQLKRFAQLDTTRREKLELFVDFPLRGLDLRTMVGGSVTPGEEPIYDLFAVSNHSGALGGGHYTALARVGDCWYEFNDDNVSKKGEHEVVTKHGYVLFYIRRDAVVDAPCLQATNQQLRHDKTTADILQDDERVTVTSGSALTIPLVDASIATYELMKHKNFVAPHSHGPFTPGSCLRTNCSEPTNCRQREFSRKPEGLDRRGMSGGKPVEGLTSKDVKEIQEQVDALFANCGWRSLVTDRISQANLPMERGSSFAFAAALFVDAQRASMERFYCFHALSRFLAFDGGRKRPEKGNVCIAIAVDQPNNTAYIAANYETVERAIEKRGYNELSATWALLLDEERRPMLLADLKSEVLEALSREKLTLLQQYQSLLEGYERRLSCSADSFFDSAKRTINELDAVLFKSLPSFDVDDTVDALLRELKKLNSMSKHRLDEGVYEPILCAELYVLNYVAAGLLSCRWDAVFVNSNRFFVCVKQYAIWKALQTHLRELIVESAYSISTDNQTKNHWGKCVKIESSKLPANSDEWMPSVMSILGFVDHHARKPYLTRYISLLGVYQWIQGKTQEYCGQLKLFWDSIANQKPAWFHLMQEAMKLFFDMKQELLPQYEGKVEARSASAVHDMHCEVTLFRFLSTRSAVTLKDLPFYISRPLCGRCVCYFFGCVSDQLRPSVLAGCLLHRKQKIEFPPEASEKEDNSIIDLVNNCLKSSIFHPKVAAVVRGIVDNQLFDSCIESIKEGPIALDENSGPFFDLAIQHLCGKKLLLTGVLEISFYDLGQLPHRLAPDITVSQNPGKQNAR